IPVDIMDSRWSTLLKISPFVSTRCADSRSCTSSLMHDSLSRALSESETASSFSNSDRCIGSPAGPRLGSETKRAGGSRVRTAKRTRAEHRVVSFAGQKIEDLVVRFQRDLLLLEPPFHFRDLELDDLPERLPR